MTTDMKKTLVRWTQSIGLLLIIGAGCGGGSSGGNDGATTACTISTSTDKACDEIYQSDATAASVARLEGDCTDSGGVVSDLCSHTGADGGCKLAQTNGGVTIAITNWYYTGNTATEMESCIGGGGTWIAP